MLYWYSKAARTLVFASLSLALSVSYPVVWADAAKNGSQRLQELLYGEALFHSQQQNYFSAITRLQLAGERGALPPSHGDAGLLLARLKLAYGLDVDAAFEFHALLDEQVPDAARNRAWYELAKAFFHKGHTDAAKESLDNIHGVVPEDIRGDLQLLHATVLMSSGQNSAAAEMLEQWKGKPEQAGYAHYNRGVALMRLGDYGGAIDSFKRVAEQPAEGEQWLALRDKTNLSLAYAFSQTGRLQQAQNQLEEVRLQGPYSNRALLALGWIAHKQGRTEAALVPWMELRGRSPTDPAVLETLLTVPAAYRELNSLQVAAQDYETAVATLSDELRSLNDTQETVRDGSTVSLLLQKDPVSSGSSGEADQASARPHARYLGRLLASRDFQQTLQGHSELRSMLREIDEGLNSIDRLAKAVEPGKARTDRVKALSPSARPGQTSGASPAGKGTAGAEGGARNRLPDDPQWTAQWEERQGQQPGQLPPAIPLLPEIDLPDSSVLKPLPQSEFSGLPESEFSGLPGEPEPRALLAGPQDIALPVSRVVWLPETGRLQLPWDDEDYAYPDAIARFEPRVQPGEKRRRTQRINAPDEDVGFYAGAQPVGEALRELAVALSSATDRMARLSQAFDDAPPDVDGLEDRIAALRDRIFRLRGRVNHAIGLNESYTQALALDELNRRQHQLEDLLEQASLELAKTYDQAADN
jgi:tetratricopeptide (TPR) repeat protein